MPVCPDCGSDRVNAVPGKAYCIDCGRAWRTTIEQVSVRRRSTGEFRGSR